MKNYIDETFLETGDLVITLFKNPKSAERAYEDLLQRGYDKNDISVMMTEDLHKKYLSDQNLANNELGSEAIEGLGVGGAIGGTVGAIAAAIAAMGTSLVIPGLGIVIAGFIAAGLAGAGAGAFAGGLIGTLIGLGISDKQAEEFQVGIKAGGIVLGVHTKSPADYKLLSDQWAAFQREDS